MQLGVFTKMIQLQKDLIRVLAESGISEIITLVVVTTLTEEETIMEFLDRMLEEEKRGSEMCDKTVTKIIMEMIHEAFTNSSGKNSTENLD